jgi:hypothetical protein
MKRRNRNADRRPTPEVMDAGGQQNQPATQDDAREREVDSWWDTWLSGGDR